MDDEGYLTSDGKYQFRCVMITTDDGLKAPNWPPELLAEILGLSDHTVTQNPDGSYTHTLTPRSREPKRKAAGDE